MTPPAGGPATPPPGGSACPTSFTIGTQVAFNVTWAGSLAIVAGSGPVNLWTKSKVTVNGGSMTLTTQACGTKLPEITTAAIAGGQKILPEFPDMVWDNAMMPSFTGTATQTGNMMNIESGVALLGLTMTDPLAPWPAKDMIMGFDHDGDGNLGITSVPRTSDGFAAPPTDIGQQMRTDKLYIATRNVASLSATVEGCPQSYSGVATIKNFDTHIIGCHVLNGADCDATQSTFVDDNTPIFMPMNGTFTTKVLPDTATCADVRTAMPPVTPAAPPAM